MGSNIIIYYADKQYDCLDAIFIRQQKSMSLGDAIICASALENDLTIVTRNVKDFNWIEKLKVHNPFENQ